MWYILKKVVGIVFIAFLILTIAISVGYNSLYAIIVDENNSGSSGTGTDNSIAGSIEDAQNGFLEGYERLQEEAQTGTFLTEIFKQANDFFNAGKSNSNSSEEVGFKLQAFIKENGFYTAIRNVGYLIFAVVTIVLGLKYVFSGIEGKADIKETFISLIIGAVFFFLADGVFSFFNGTFSSIFIGTNVTFNTVSGKIFAILQAFTNVACISGIIILGVKYMVSSADKKADLKRELLPIVLGIILVFCSVQVLTFIIDVGQQVLGSTEDIEIVTPDTSGVIINGNIRNMINKFWGTFSVVVQVIAMACIVFSGVRYMFSSADKKADIKQQTVTLFIGAVLVFAAVPLINFVIDVASTMF